MRKNVPVLPILQLVFYVFQRTQRDVSWVTRQLAILFHRSTIYFRINWKMFKVTTIYIHDVPFCPGLLRSVNIYWTRHE